MPILHLRGLTVVMKKLIIIGARGFGREVYDLARKAYQVKGFLDDKTDALNEVRGEYPPIIGPVETYEPQEEDVFFCALGDAFYRYKYAEIILSKGGEFISLIARGAYVNPTAKIGRGCIISHGTIVSDNVDIGDFTMVHAYSSFGHDVKIGKCNSIESYCFFGGYARTGDFTTMHVRSAIIPKKHVGSNVSVGFGSVVMRNFGDGVHLFGNPAKKLEF